MVTDAAAVELPAGPVSAELVTSVKLPTCGVTRTFALVPTGMFDASSVTVTGPDGAVGNVTSGVVGLPVAVGGTGSAPIDVMCSVSVAVGDTAPGVAEMLAPPL